MVNNPDGLEPPTFALLPRLRARPAASAAGGRPCQRARRGPTPPPPPSPVAACRRAQGRRVKRRGGARRGRGARHAAPRGLGASLVRCAPRVVGGEVAEEAPVACARCAGPSGRGPPGKKGGLGAKRGVGQGKRGGTSWRARSLAITRWEARMSATMTERASYHCMVRIPVPGSAALRYTSLHVLGCEV